MESFPVSHLYTPLLLNAIKWEKRSFSSQLRLSLFVGGLAKTVSNEGSGFVAPPRPDLMRDRVMKAESYFPSRRTTKPESPTTQ